MNDSIKGPLALTLICSAVCALLAGANNLTADRIRETENNRLQQALSEAFGDGKYEALSGKYEGVSQVISDGNGRLIFDIISNGYEKGSQHLLIGIAENAVTKVYPVSITDSPTQAAAVSEASFLNQFAGWTDPDSEYDAVSGATRSSEGIRQAVARALRTYSENGELADYA